MMLFYHHLEHARHQIAIPEEDGDVFSTLLANFGRNGEKNFSKHYK